MSNETKNVEVDGNQVVDTEEKVAELVKALEHNGLVALKRHFNDVEVQVLSQPVYGHVFVFKVKDSSSNVYECGFLLYELLAKFQSNNEPAEWMASFFIELMKTEGGRALPKPPTNEEETKALIDKELVPHCIAAVQEEFAPEQVHAGLAWNEQHGPVFETGFPAIKDGNNVCAIPLHLLYTQFLLNRDPSDMLLEGLYKIREQHGLE
ncbi:hypothetical protein [Cohnella cholangitidis]|uniref:Uncharacterized protein n=1 Tax=Cohnella cholangitidis TaxID=2598458 RepID=A0A7G5BUQ2_9BACL|nr:hypothetical protein [Cohnella cholangitidis]QMV40686.1 hypothetical protein FPL14_05315 [Cohnella cholangitidis]